MLLVGHKLFVYNFHHIGDSNSGFANELVNDRRLNALDYTHAPTPVSGNFAQDRNACSAKPFVSEQFSVGRNTDVLPRFINRTGANFPQKTNAALSIATAEPYKKLRCVEIVFVAKFWKKEITNCFSPVSSATPSILTVPHKNGSLGPQMITDIN